jgi:DHA3 family tetracycline resistance protein-like MFS transporter
MRLTGIIGPGIGAAAVATGGTWFAFTIDALSFFIAAIAVFPILRRGWNTATNDKPRSALIDLREGFGFVRATPWLWISIVVFSFANFAQAGPAVVLLPVLVKNELHLGVEALGAIYTAASIGATLGAIWLGSYKRLPYRGWMFYAFAVCISLSVAGLGLSTSGGQSIWAVVAVLLGLNFLNGLSNSGAGMCWNTLLQDKIPRDMLGRVASIDALGSLALLPLGFGAAGWIAESIGAANTLLLGGLLSALATVLGLIHPNIRQLD